MTDNPTIPEDEMLNGEPSALEQTEKQRDEYLSLLRQVRADFENAHQRNRREREQEQKFRSERLALDLLPVIDNLERALSVAKEAGDENPLAQGVALVHAQLIDALKRHGIVALDVLGKSFDPNVHQALMQQPAPEREPGSVLQVLEPGYTIHDRVLRPAKVIIAAS